MKAKFVSNSHESVRMFKSGLLEALSKVHFSVPLFVFIPIISFFIWKALSIHSGWLTMSLSIAGGLLFWTVAEYALHRFVFHFEPSSRWGQRIHFIFHGVHHDYPNDAMRLVMPPSASLPLAALFYLLFMFILPESYLYGFFAAFLTGYLFYDISHYALHHAHFKSAFWKKLKHHHMMHHYSDPTKGYGVSSALWDKILKSDFDKNAE